MTVGQPCNKCDEYHERGEFGLRRSTAHEAIDADYEPIEDVCPCKCHADEWDDTEWAD